ncbi:MAG: adenine phosphoribosyltransferase [Microthrixaceae bacterium]|nr:adenine phosphoribosyltransferase [Microthrixaceae bacterium]MCO5312554.1 adenine phosphoribosyltransferase [Microthrixaceae bacterium]
MTPEDLSRFITDLPDYPAPGVTFRDITPLLADGSAFNSSIDTIAEPFFGKVDVVAGIEARGFVFAAPVAVRLGVGFVPVRKPGKLPRDVHRQEYALEYGTDTLEIHSDAVSPGQRVLLVDDVLATGGTAGAAVALLRSVGATVVATSFLVELVGLGGRSRVPDVAVSSIVTYD